MFPFGETVVAKVCGGSTSITANMQSYTFEAYCPLCIGLMVDFYAAPRDPTEQRSQYNFDGSCDSINILDEGVYNYGSAYSIAFRVVTIRGVQAGSTFQIGYEYGTHLTYVGIYIAE